MDNLLDSSGLEIPASQTTVLVIDDDPGVLELLVDLLTPEGYDLITAARGGDGLSLIEERSPRVALVDKNLPDMSGVEVIRAGRDVSPETEFIMITGYASLESAVEVMRAGVFDYIPKPLPSLDTVRIRVREALARNLAVYKYRLLTERLRFAYEELYRKKADLGVEKMLRDRKPQPSEQLEAARERIHNAADEAGKAVGVLERELHAIGNDYFKSLAEPLERIMRDLAEISGI